MRDVFIIGVGRTPVREHWEQGLRTLGARAIRAALTDAQLERTDCLFVGNMLGSLFGQDNVATLIADAAGVLPAEAYCIEAACASGAAAVRAAAMAVASGAHDMAVALGVEKMTDAAAEDVAAALAAASDHDFEASMGMSFPSMAALLMRRYMHETGCSRESFAPFAVTAHQNGATSDFAMYREPITVKDYERSAEVASPVTVLDAAPICDGAAAVVLCAKEMLRPHHRPVRIAAASAATDTISLALRKDPLVFASATHSASRAFEMARLQPRDMHLFEVHDAFTIMTVLSLEACGFARRGEGVKLADQGVIGLGGTLPISTFGGLKARGHPVGASGVYQIVEAAVQLRGEAGTNQVAGARRALTQSLGGHASVAVTHILEA